jgi:hypothetical protein
VSPHGQLGDFTRLVGRIVEDLDFEELLRIVHLAHGLDQPIDHIHLVEKGQLDRHERERVVHPGRNRFVFLVLHVKIHKVIAMPAVHGENDQNEEIGPQREAFKRRHKVCAILEDPSRAL